MNASFVMFQSADLVKVQRAFNLLNTLGVWLPIVALVLIALGVYVAQTIAGRWSAPAWAWPAAWCCWR